jgi:hypothetical protein
MWATPPRPAVVALDLLAGAGEDGIRVVVRA